MTWHTQGIHMGILRTILLFELLRNSKDTAIAKKDKNGEPICGECREKVKHKATKCRHCQSGLYTRRGRVARRSFVFFGFSFVISPLIPDYATISILLVPIGLVLLSMYWSLRKDRPNRRLHLRERIPLINK